jgi:antitoxin component YwqK of YwqJK toxin-antitoxin module
LNEKAYYYFTNSDLIKRIDYYDTLFPAKVAGEEYFYYNNDSFKYKLEYKFNIANSNFDTITKVQHLYYPNGKIHKKIRFELDTSTNILDTVRKEEYL